MAELLVAAAVLSLTLFDQAALEESDIIENCVGKPVAFCGGMVGGDGGCLSSGNWVLVEFAKELTEGGLVLVNPVHGADINEGVIDGGGNRLGNQGNAAPAHGLGECFGESGKGARENDDMEAIQ